jgi:hypothetical protein
MKIPELVPIDEIVSNPWRDFSLYPLDDKHVANLCGSINDDDFYSGLKGRRRNDKVEIACGHARVEAARMAGRTHIPVCIDDIDDDGMLRIMINENALQFGSSPGAALNEVAATTRRLIEGLYAMSVGQPVPHSVSKVFETRATLEKALTKLQSRLADPDAEAPVSYQLIMRYLGSGDEKATKRGERQIRGALSALQQSGCYDKMIDEALHKYAPAAEAPPSDSTTVAKPKQPTKRRPRIFDERTANLFPIDHQFDAFRQAVTTWDAQKLIPVENQYQLAKQIMDYAGLKEFNKKQLTASYIETWSNIKCWKA